MANTEVKPDNGLESRDTVVDEDRAAFDEFMKKADGDTYTGYFYDRNNVWIKIHNADTHEVIEEKTFRGNGKAMEYLLQGPGGMKPEDLTPDGPKAHACDKC